MSHRETTSPATVTDAMLAGAISATAPGAAREEEAELYRRFAPRVRLYGLKHLRDAAAAQDLVQQVFLIAIERLRRGEVRNMEAIGSFLLGTSRTVAADLRRRAERRERLTDTFADRTTSFTLVEDTLDNERLKHCLNSLPARDRTLLVLTFYAEKKAADIASDLQMAPGAIRVARHRALTRLRECVMGSATMTGEQCSRGAPFADLLDYWVGDMDQTSPERVEAHVFECAECADRLADVATIAATVAEAVRGARIQTIINDAVLNKLSRDGLRIRTYAPEPGRFIPCAIWPEDDLIVTRLKGDFSGYDELTLVLQSEEGPEVSRNVDIPLVSGTDEILIATSGAHLRQLPSMRLRMIVSGTRGDTEQVIAEYGLEHGGTMRR